MPTNDEKRTELLHLRNTNLNQFPTDALETELRVRGELENLTVADKLNSEARNDIRQLIRHAVVIDYKDSGIQEDLLDTLQNRCSTLHHSTYPFPPISQIRYNGCVIRNSKNNNLVHINLEFMNMYVPPHPPTIDELSRYKR